MNTPEERVPINAERVPIVRVMENEAYANSRDVAAFFGKQNYSVNRDIRNLIAKDTEWGRRNFVSNEINDLTGAAVADFDMTRDGFMMLTMGFSGEKAFRLKLKYVDAFNAMEAEINRREEATDYMEALSSPDALRGLLLTYTEKAIELQGQVDELLPKADALKRISEADGSLCVTDAAKALQIRPKDLFGFLRQNEWIYRRTGASHDVAYQRRIVTGLLEHKVTTVSRSDGSERTTEQVRVTPKGLARLAEVFGTQLSLVA